jgi:hypothetical protein
VHRGPVGAGGRDRLRTARGPGACRCSAGRAWNWRVGRSKPAWSPRSARQPCADGWPTINRVWPGQPPFLRPHRDRVDHRPRPVDSPADTQPIQHRLMQPPTTPRWSTRRAGGARSPASRRTSPPATSTTNNPPGSDTRSPPTPDDHRPAASHRPEPASAPTVSTACGQLPRRARHPLHDHVIHKGTSSRQPNPPINKRSFSAGRILLLDETHEWALPDCHQPRREGSTCARW